MSALAKPLIYSESTINGSSDSINVEQVLAISRTTVENGIGNTKSRYAIEYNMANNGTNPRIISWTYETEALRDADYALVLDAVATEIV